MSTVKFLVKTLQIILVCFDFEKCFRFLNKIGTMQHLQSNQIRVVAFNVPQLAQASFLQKNQTLQMFF
jgi:hypothetical protein